MAGNKIVYFDIEYFDIFDAKQNFTKFYGNKSNLD